MSRERTESRGVQSAGPTSGSSKTRPRLAASVTEFTGTESFTGIFVALGRAICPGHSPTGGWRPCPAGSRTHLRGLVRIWEDAFTDPRVCGTNVTTESWNVDETLTGPI